MSKLLGFNGIAVMNSLAQVSLKTVSNANVTGNFFEAGSLWKDKPALIFVVRRPG